jgi:uncharacterized protein (TIGR03437 family)
LAILCLAVAAQAQTPGRISTHSLPLFGGSYIDPSGYIYTTGSGGPVTPGAAQTQSGGGNCPVNAFPVGSIPELCPDASVVKIDPAGNVVFGTLLGGPGSDAGASLAVDSTGAVFVTGHAGTGFPTTSTAANPASPNANAFAAKLSADGSAFLYSTYLPDSVGAASAIAIDAQGNAYVTGISNAGHASVTKIAPDGSAFVFTVTTGGSNRDAGDAIAIDASGNVIVAGHTLSNDLPITSNAAQSQSGGGQDVFIAKFDPTGKLLFETYLGGSGTDRPNVLKLDAAGNIYVAGSTNSLDFPVTAGAFQSAPPVPLWNNNGPGGFLAKLSPDAGALLYSTYVPSADSGPTLTLGVSSIAVTPGGDVYFTGAAGAGFPVTPSAPHPCSGASPDAFVAHLDGSGHLVDSTYLGAPINAAQLLGLAADGSLYFVWHNSGNSMLSQIRFGAGGWAAPACLSNDLLNGATMQGNLQFTFGANSPSISRGELLTLTGIGIGPEVGVGYPAGAASIPTSLGGVQVFFDQTPAPILYAQSRQINVVVPFELSGSTTNVTVTYNGAKFGPVSALLLLNTASVGLFRAQPGVSTQAFAINADGTMNGAANPAPAGSVVTLLGTGFGPSTPLCPTGAFSGSQSSPVIDSDVRFFVTPPVMFIGSAPQQPCGISEIQLMVPERTPPGLLSIVPQTSVPIGVTIVVK